MQVFKDLTGKKFGELEVLRKATVKRNWWVARCSCGNKVTLPAHKLHSGNNRSCGCLKKSVLGMATRKHGRANSRITGYANRTYGVWQAMRARCLNPKNNRWSSYGGRGIKICKRWEKFENFIADMGEIPKGLTLDRINVDGDYKPSNCRWATWLEQAQNKRKKRK